MPDAEQSGERREREEGVQDGETVRRQPRHVGGRRRGTDEKLPPHAGDEAEAAEQDERHPGGDDLHPGTTPSRSLTRPDPAGERDELRPDPGRIGAIGREHGALSREHGALSREHGALSREHGAIGGEFGAGGWRLSLVRSAA